MKVAITGGIGSGKSYVCRLLTSPDVSRLWAQPLAIYDCDAAAKRLMRTSSALKQKLIQLIGPDTYLPDGALNKGRVAQFLLSSEQHAQAVDAVVHPAVAEDFILSGLQWMECAILYESGFDRFVDRVIVVTAPEEVRLQRIMQRDGITLEKAHDWIARQWPQEDVRKRADFEIVNDGLQPLLPQIERILKLITT